MEPPELEGKGVSITCPNPDGTETVFTLTMKGYSQLFGRMAAKFPRVLDFYGSGAFLLTNEEAAYRRELLEEMTR